MQVADAILDSPVLYSEEELKAIAIHSGNIIDPKTIEPRHESVGPALRLIFDAG